MSDINKKVDYLVRKLRAVGNYKTRTVAAQASLLRRLAADPAHNIRTNPQSSEMRLLDLIDIAIDTLAYQTSAIPLDGHNTEISRELRSDVFGNIDPNLAQDFYNYKETTNG